MSFWRQTPAARRWLSIIGWQTQIRPGPGSSRMQAKQLLVRTPAGSLHTTVALPDWADTEARFGARHDVVLAVVTSDTTCLVILPCMGHCVTLEATCILIVSTCDCSQSLVMRLPISSKAGKA